jgi:hypothetical protein
VVNILETAEVRREQDSLGRAKYGGGGGRQQALAARSTRPGAGGARSTRKQERSTRDKTCFYCKEPGHFKRDCTKYQAAVAEGKVP